MTIDYALGRCRLGAFIVAVTPRGICALELGDCNEALVDGLARRFPRAALQAAPKAFDETRAAVAAFLDRTASALPLPLDIQGTAFQQRVWQALRAIPAGQTRSYALLAAELGNPRAVRAVAGACAANKIAVAIPCHRVVRSDGGLSGYRWGVARKRTLLESECAKAAS